MNTIEDRGHIYEIVDAIPAGYMIWNIGKNIIDGYLPLCRPARQQPFPGGRSIDVDALKAIKIDGAQDILAAAGKGEDTLEEMERYVKRYNNAKGGWTRTKVERYKKAIPIMKQIRGIENLKKWEDLQPTTE